MIGEMPDTRRIVERLEKVERQNRRLKLTGVVALILASGILLMGQALPKSKTVEAERIVLKDTNGKARIILEANGKERLGLYWGTQPRIAFLDTNGTTRTMLAISDNEPYLEDDPLVKAYYAKRLEGDWEKYAAESSLRRYAGVPQLVLFDFDGKERIKLTLEENGPAIRLKDSKDEMGISMGVEDGRGCGLALLGQLEEPISFDGTKVQRKQSRICLNILSESAYEPRLAFINANAKEQIVLKAPKKGPTLQLSDANGKTRAALGVASLTATRTGERTETSPSSLILFDEEQKVLWKVP